MLNNAVVSNVGESFISIVPFVGALGVFVLVMNFTGLIGISPPTKNFSVTLTLALISFVMVQGYAIKKNGAAINIDYIDKDIIRNLSKLNYAAAGTGVKILTIDSEPYMSEYEPPKDVANLSNPFILPVSFLKFLISWFG